MDELAKKASSELYTLTNLSSICCSRYFGTMAEQLLGSSVVCVRDIIFGCCSSQLVGLLVSVLFRI